MCTTTGHRVLGVLLLAPSIATCSAADLLLAAGTIRSDNALKLKLAWCPPGQFRMGSPLDEEGRQADEDQVDVTLTHGFWLGRTEVTQAQWKSIMGTDPWLEHGDPGSYRPGADYPAVFVSHNEAMSCCAKLTNQEQHAGRLSLDWKYTLPTEAQWEYACRSGSTTRYSFGREASQLANYAWFDENAAKVGEKYAHQVGQKRGNFWGLVDMPGNVYEWCRDAYVRELPGGRDPLTTAGPDRVYRAGSWSYASEYCRSANRGWNDPANRFYYLGFRIACVRLTQDRVTTDD
ncbi:MAG: formylglycine-generating enzyme family protein [Fuerstiella sp.]|nr:formylglycine-generating enzyme family protein [Fuerstiella sp.]